MKKENIGRILAVLRNAFGNLEGNISIAVREIESLMGVSTTSSRQSPMFRNFTMKTPSTKIRKPTKLVMAPKFVESDVAEIEDVLMGQATKANEANKTNLAYKADQMHVYDVGQGTRQPFIMLTGIYDR